MVNVERQLFTHLLHDLNSSYGLDVQPEDINPFLDAFPDYESWSEVLPLWDTFLLSGLSTGMVDFSAIPGGTFRGQPLLAGLWYRVFRPSGDILPNPSAYAIFGIRQTACLFKKVFAVCSPERVKAAVDGFITTDAGLECDPDPRVAHVNELCHGAALRSIGRSDLTSFRHGPGAVAERLDAVGRWDFPAVSAYVDSLQITDFMAPNYRPAPWGTATMVGRLTSVPKTALKPRLISIEPASNMFVQQGLLASLDAWMRRVPQINMRDQSRNQALARLGSVNGAISTIDLSEASDRVSMELVRAVFKTIPSFLSMLEGMRTPVIQTGGSFLRLNKFASMGCALTFPVQILVFRTLVLLGICRAENDFTDAFIRRWSHSPEVGVYGDDIIVPTRYYGAVCDVLEEHSLVVNRDKSFHTGSFRESCGGDYYDGVPVNPVYIRRRVPKDRDVDSIVSLAATSLLFEERGLSSVAQYLSDHLQGLVGPMPGGRGAVAVSHPWNSSTRYNAGLQSHEVKAIIFREQRPKVKASDSAILAHALSGVTGGYNRQLSGPEPFDPLRLERHTRRYRGVLTRRWVSIQQD